jgi:proteasome accessory factor B
MKIKNNYKNTINAVAAAHSQTQNQSETDPRPKIENKIPSSRGEGQGEGDARAIQNQKSKIKNGEPPCRDSLARMKSIHEYLAANKYPNTSTLKADLEISIRTLKRDIDYMRDYLQLPIDFDKHRNGYFYSQPVTNLFGAPNLTSAERLHLLLAHQALSQYPGTGLDAPMLRAVEKLMPPQPNPKSSSSQNRKSAFGDRQCLRFRPFAPEDCDVALFKLVTEAVTDSRPVKFTYRKPGEKLSSPRHVHPYTVICGDNRWYLIGWDIDRAAMRQFALSRISKQKLLTGHFTKRDDFDIDDYLRGSFSVLSGTGDYHVTIDFDPWSTDMLRGRIWHQSQQITENPDGSSRVTLHLTALEEVERWLLSWGTHATVLGPRSLTEKIRNTASALAKQYGG